MSISSVLGAVGRVLFMEAPVAHFYPKSPGSIWHLWHVHKCHLETDMTIWYFWYNIGIQKILEEQVIKRFHCKQILHRKDLCVDKRILLKLVTRLTMCSWKCTSSTYAVQKTSSQLGFVHWDLKMSQSRWWVALERLSSSLPSLSSWEPCMAPEHMTVT